MLAKSGVELNVDSVLRFLEDEIPDKEKSQRIDDLVRRLASPDFNTRQLASRDLRQIGSHARPALLQATKSSQLEVSYRAANILAYLAANDDPYQREMKLLAALDWLAEHPDARTPQVLFACSPLTKRIGLRSAFQRATWASAKLVEPKFFASCVKGDEAFLIATGLVGWEIADPEGAVANIRPWLQNASPDIQLAAARALANTLPQLSAETFNNLLNAKEPRIRLQARLLLEALTGDEFNLHQSANAAEAIAAWRKRNRSESGQWKVQPLGEERYTIRSAGLVFSESFDLMVKPSKNNLGLLEYQGPADASVAALNGQLFINTSTTAECDVRMFVPAKSLVGEPFMPDSFRVHTKMGGSSDGSGGYHVGLSIGNVKVLFHPGYTGGAFRVEHVKTHDYLITNSSMGFNPLGDQTYETTVLVRKQSADTTLFEVQIRDHGKGGAVFKKEFTLPTSATGPIDRVGLERSGRTGGPAIFDELRIVVNDE